MRVKTFLDRKAGRSLAEAPPHLLGFRTVRGDAVMGDAPGAGSSRSHCVLYLHIERAFPGGNICHSKVCLVDLAGSERQDKVKRLWRFCAWA